MNVEIETTGSSLGHQAVDYLTAYTPVALPDVVRVGIGVADGLEEIVLSLSATDARALHSALGQFLDEVDRSSPALSDWTGYSLSELRRLRLKISDRAEEMIGPFDGPTLKAVLPEMHGMLRELEREIDRREALLED